MNVASLPLCKELYELSEWDEQFPVLLHYLDNEVWHKKLYQSDARDELTYCPAYTTGYLLRKLPAYLSLRQEMNVSRTGINGVWVAEYWSSPNRDSGRHEIAMSSESVENAVTSLAIELFKQNILTKET